MENLLEYQICKNCVLDTTDKDIVFDAEGVCNYCREVSNNIDKFIFSPEQEKENLTNLVAKIKQEQKGEYDSILGVSGGVDSSYLMHLAHSLGLNPLIVHFDNGWNSELAVSNIKKIIEKCGFHLETYVIDWPEFKDLQRSFFKAGVLDIELLTDQAIVATMFKIRRQHKIKYVLSGTNYRTEYGMPPSWAWRKFDYQNIKDIQSKFGTRKIKSFPIIRSWQFQLIKMFGLGGEFVEPLNMINYRKLEIMKFLQQEYGWEYYGGKHYESVFTKFYQAYVLPVKFKIDKRRPHLSSLIRNNEITREDAIRELNEPIYKPEVLRSEKEYVLKKLDFSEAEFDAMMAAPPKSHLDYKSDDWMFKIWGRFRRNK
ncbi:N-acetyl sugar amidotransferase [Chryseotalea sanaruensis]|uniref:N-acetyl sugar amidotransferase n=1 Tax=Chryseotalea sanaruensis TaxID=2482724 RepID=A0A401UC65_9BACT|nr:N-acetyl sugar amidotransferase [Chryseotalea sanaruensis]GCC52465.1 N-acetyl sugar amidotransferase [Chryseotalea sanaruensis]